jgi:dTDP-glucose 4,6-dehydratase
MLARVRWPDAEIVVLDALTYAGNLANLPDGREAERITFVRGDICSPSVVESAVQGCSHVVNFAAETHVDRSFTTPSAFVLTNIEGTRVLLEAAHRAGIARFLQVSTDEIYGEIAYPARASESAPFRPGNLYATTKATADALVLGHRDARGTTVVITRGSNTYGPRQYPEKLVPLVITNALENEPIPVYGDGLQVRDWLHVTDHCEAIALALERGEPGAIYNIAAENERSNLEVIEDIISLIGAQPSLIQHIADRPGHDRRYAVTSDRIRALGWQPSVSYQEGLADTVRWYRSHEEWWQAIKSGAYRAYYEQQYRERLGETERRGKL